MLTRSRTRKALKGIQKQEEGETLSPALLKPPVDSPASVQRSTSQKGKTQAVVSEKDPVPRKNSGVAKMEAPDFQPQSVGEIAGIAKSFNVISLDSDDSSEDDEDISSEIENSDISEKEDDGRATKINRHTVSSLDDKELIQHVQDDDIYSIRVDVCKSYLRKHGLRLKGKKVELINRIKERLELMKEGPVPEKYAPSTFTIDCTGDVCNGDVVMFDQAVYEKMHVKLGWRTIAGRVVSESYGAQRQQHTFTIEVYWSTGCRPKAPMEPLRIKGRNLYKIKTLRQRWDDEGERNRILDEKHERGAVARHTRANGGPPLSSKRTTVTVSQQRILSRQTPSRYEGPGDSLVVKQHRQWFGKVTEPVPLPPISKGDSTFGLQSSSMHSKPSSLFRDGPTSPHRTGAIFPSSHQNSKTSPSRAHSPYQNKSSSSSKSYYNRTSSPYGRSSSYRSSSPYRPQSPYQNRSSSLTSHHSRTSSPYGRSSSYRPSSPCGPHYPPEAKSFSSNSQPSKLPSPFRPSSPCRTFFVYRPDSRSGDRPFSSNCNSSGLSSPYRTSSSSRSSPPFHNSFFAAEHSSRLSSSPYRNNPSSRLHGIPSVTTGLHRPPSPLVNRSSTTPSMGGVIMASSPPSGTAPWSCPSNASAEHHAAATSLGGGLRGPQQQPPQRYQFPMVSTPFSDAYLWCSGPCCASKASKHCSNSLCYYCCKKKGGPCAHRTHRGKPL